MINLGTSSYGDVLRIVRSKMNQPVEVFMHQLFFLSSSTFFLRNNKRYSEMGDIYLNKPRPWTLNMTLLARNNCSKLSQSKRIHETIHVVYDQDDTWAKSQINRWRKPRLTNIKDTFYTISCHRVKILQRGLSNIMDYTEAQPKV